MSSALQLFAPYRCRRAGRICQGRLHPVGNYHDKPSGKPFGGVWTSTYTPDAPSESDWVRFCQQEHSDWIPAYGYLYNVDSAANLLVLNSLEDLAALVARYGLRHPFPPLAVDWKAIACDFDGVRLTAAGLAEGQARSLELWDAECTVWFNITVLHYEGRVRLRRLTVPKHSSEE